MKICIISLFLILFISSCTINNYYDCDCCENENGGNQIVMQPNAEFGKDAFIENYPSGDYLNRNFGNSIEFMANAWTSQGIPLVIRSLIEFDLSEIPQQGKIKSAKLFLYAAESIPYHIGHSNRSGSNDFIIQRITTEWDEMGVTWNTQPETTTKGQVFIEGSHFVMQDYEIVITGLIQDIIENPSQGHGFMIKLVTEEYYRRLLFASSDYEDSSKHPKLVIEFDE